jgi:Mlc titration factor MtfA (ptsG expression regulator)
MRWPFARAPRPQIDRSQWIADDAWHALLAQHAYLERLSENDRSRLRVLCGDFLATKAVNGAAGLVLTQTMIARIAMQACLPILELGIEAYPQFTEIIVYPSDFVIERETVDENGVVHEWSESAAGESWGDGPVVLSWQATESASGSDRPMPHAYNVVIHEFAHKLDMGNDGVDGMPAFSRRFHPTLNARDWQRVLEETFDTFAAEVEAVERSIPRHVDPESARADRYYAKLALDAYAATDEAEFFSVSSEAFFVAPARLRDAFPAWYAMLADYYRQDPLRR